MEHEPAIAPISLRADRIHDVVGASAKAFAIMRACEIMGPLIWIDSNAQQQISCPQGIAEFFDLRRLIVVHSRTEKDVLWCMEEALRGVSGMVVGAFYKPVNLLESRRLQLAAEAGRATGLCLVPEGAVNNAAETRWRSTPLLARDTSSLHRWDLIKNKKGILGRWDVRWNTSAHSFTVVSASCGGAHVTQQPDVQSAPLIRSGADAKERLAALLDQRGG